jgi:hypothetical protein
MSTVHTYRRRAAALAAALAMGALAVAPAQASSSSSLAQVRQATVAYHSLAAAEDAGYEQFLPCFDSPGVGGMGQHFADFGAIDGTVEALHPEVLVYEPRPNGYRFVAVEYVVPQSAWEGAQPPSLFGEEFHRNDTLGIWALHAWIWRGNPLGVHADFNPTVRLCPSS